VVDTELAVDVVEHALLPIISLLEDLVFNTEGSTMVVVVVVVALPNADEVTVRVVVQVDVVAASRTSLLSLTSCIMLASSHAVTGSVGMVVVLVVVNVVVVVTVMVSVCGAITTGLEAVESMPGILFVAVVVAASLSAAFNGAAGLVTAIGVRPAAE
jgi:hypothetical protein